jgi:hypothetical protein
LGSVPLRQGGVAASGDERHNRGSNKEPAMAFETIAQVEDLSQARVLVVALRAHGFHPLESGEGGLPGVRGLFGPRGVPVQVPEEEARDATLLARELLKEMQGP